MVRLKAFAELLRQLEQLFTFHYGQIKSGRVDDGRVDRAHIYIPLWSD